MAIGLAMLMEHTVEVALKTNNQAPIGKDWHYLLLKLPGLTQRVEGDHMDTQILANLRHNGPLDAVIRRWTSALTASL